MSITEATFYPIFGKATKERWEKDTARRKGGLGMVWRFKIFNYADKNGILAEHPTTMMLRKGATVEIRCYNHPLFATGFTTKGGAPMVELMCVIYPTYGDKIKVLKQPNTIIERPAAAAPIVNHAGTPTGAASPELVAAITAQVLATIQGKAAPASNAAAPVKTKSSSHSAPIFAYL
jgi:hypothetical protein